MPWINRGDTLSGTAFFPLQDAVAERLAYIAAISGPGESCASVLAQTYCEFMPEASGETGRLMAGVVISTVERYAGWLEVAERALPRPGIRCPHWNGLHVCWSI